MSSSVSCSLVSTAEALSEMVNAISRLPQTGEPALYIDIEGIKLSREGSVSFVTIYAQPDHHVYLVDVHNLQGTAFTTSGPDGSTLKSILESPTVTKVFFDVRNDSDALFSHFGIHLNGIEDIQLMENAARPAGTRRFVNGLERCIDRDARASPANKKAWKAAKEKGVALFHPSRGGSYEVFNARPLDADIQCYCINDVTFLPQLRAMYWGRLSREWRDKVAAETSRRLRESQAPSYQPQSETKRFGPWERPGWVRFC